MYYLWADYQIRVKWLFNIGASLYFMGSKLLGFKTFLALKQIKRGFLLYESFVGAQ